MQTLHYGAAPSQVGDLHLPNASRAPVVCLLHGGFWRMPYGRDELTPIAEDLVDRGWAVWNLEYRRIGEPGAGWPGTLLDVAAGIDHLASAAEGAGRLDLERVVVAGHSAGGQLAAWSAAVPPRDGPLHRVRRVVPMAVASLAGVLDLQEAFALDAGNGAVASFLGGSPDQYPERYASASPIKLLPLGVPQLILHGTADDALPVSLARRYAAAARGSESAVTYIEFAGGGHMEYVDPASDAHTALCRWLESLA